MHDVHKNSYNMPHTQQYTADDDDDTSPANPISYEVAVPKAAPRTASHLKLAIIVSCRERTASNKTFRPFDASRM